MASGAIKPDPKKAKTAPGPGKATENAADTSAINSNEIAARSYELWQERGCPTGSPDVDWFRAEEELKSQRQEV